MGHVIDKIVLHLSQLLLTENDVDGEDESDQQHQREDERGNHEADRVEDIVATSREMDLHHAHACGWVVEKEGLCIGVLFTLVRKVRAAIDLAAVAILHPEVVLQFNTVVNQSRFDVLIQVSKVHTLLNGSVTGPVDHGPNHVIDQRTLVEVTVLNHVRQRARRLRDVVLTMLARNHCPGHRGGTVAEGFQLHMLAHGKAMGRDYGTRTLRLLPSLFLCL